VNRSSIRFRRTRHAALLLAAATALLVAGCPAPVQLDEYIAQVVAQQLEGKVSPGPAGPQGPPGQDGVAPVGAYVLTQSSIAPNGYTYSGLTVPVGEQWTNGASLPVPVDSHAAVVLDDRIYILGGLNNGTATAAVYAYDLATGTWTARAPLNEARYELAAVALNGAIYAIGGEDGKWSRSLMTTVERYDPVADRWDFVAPLQHGRNGLAAGVIDGRIYAVGGNDGAAHDALEIYDPATDQWTTGANLPIGREFLAAAVLNGKLYAVGGQGVPPNHAGASGMVDVYDPAQNAWTSETSLVPARISPCAAVLQGRIYVAGGFNPEPLDGVSAFDPDAHVWRAAAPLPVDVSGATAVELAGQLYVVGGFSASQTYKSVAAMQVYTPATTFYLHQKN